MKHRFLSKFAEKWCIQGNVETLFRWGGKRLYHFCSKFIQETVYQMLLGSPEFRKRYYVKHFGLIFLDTV